MFLDINALNDVCKGRKIFFSPYNSPSIQLNHVMPVSVMEQFAGYIDSHKNYAGVFKPEFIDDEDAIVIVSSPMYWREISSSIKSKTIYLNTPKGFILLHDYEFLIDNGEYFDCVIAAEEENSYQFSLNLAKKLSNKFYSIAIVSHESAFDWQGLKSLSFEFNEPCCCYLSVSVGDVWKIKNDVNLTIIYQKDRDKIKAYQNTVVNETDSMVNVLFFDGYKPCRKTILPRESIRVGNKFIDDEDFISVVIRDLNILTDNCSPFYNKHTDSSAYFIADCYMSPCKYYHYNDLDETDGWQLEVYLFALGLMIKNNYSSIADVGCGSAYKLVTYFGNYNSIGVELPKNVEFLKEKYPSNVWLETDFSKRTELDVDIIVFSDVIEHLVDPTVALEYLQCQNFKYLVISTPAKEFLYKEGDPFYFGPPKNPAHQREWTMSEFRDYIGQFFSIVDQRLSSHSQSTQMIICKKQ